MVNKKNQKRKLRKGKRQGLEVEGIVIKVLIKLPI